MSSSTERLSNASAPAPRPRYWLLLLFAALLLSPPAWAVATLIAVAIGGLMAPGLRTWAAARAPVSAEDGTVVGVDAAGRPVSVTDRQLSAHTLIVGASGAGKTTTLLTILTDHIQRGRPVIAIDMKGSPAFAAQLRAAAAAAGRPFKLWTLEGPSSWNPLQYGNATELKDKLIATERFTEPHYQRAAERYVQAALNVLHRVEPERPPTLDAVVELMEPRRLGALTARLPFGEEERVQDYLATLTPDQLSAVRGLATRLAIVSESETGAFLCPRGGADVVDVRRGLAGQEVILFSLNSSTYGKLAAQVGTLVVQDLIAGVGHRLAALGPAAVRGIVAVDEFSALGAENVLSLIARGREAGTGLLLSTQELADLDRAARGLREQVLGSTAVKIIHRQDVPASAQTIAQIAGTAHTWEETRQIGGGLFGSSASGRGTLRPVEKFLVHPNEIKRLPTGAAVVITKTPQARVQKVRVAAPDVMKGRLAGTARGASHQRGPELA